MVWLGTDLSELCKELEAELDELAAQIAAAE